MTTKPDLSVEAPEVYLGDGLYASFDGFQICLRAPRAGGNDLVFLEPQVYDNLKTFVENLKASGKTRNG